jgi:ferredoxin
MPKIKFATTEEEIDLESDSLIAEVCEDAGVPFACTEGVCGTCVIEVTDGMSSLSQPTQEEVDFLGEECLSEERLACQCKILNGDITIDF